MCVGLMYYCLAQTLNHPAPGPEIRGFLFSTTMGLTAFRNNANNVNHERQAKTRSNPPE